MTSRRSAPSCRKWASCPAPHGSALVHPRRDAGLVVATLGTGEESSSWTAWKAPTRKTSCCTNFPPFSVGETRPHGFARRREIGHGKLAWARHPPMLPSKHEFPYTLRVVSEILESNGSSSMATVCGASLSLMDAGVPLRRPVAGIAMGLIWEEGKFAVLWTSWVTKITSATWTSRWPAPSVA